jgi:hypothetical protein
MTDSFTTHTPSRPAQRQAGEPPNRLKVLLTEPSVTQKDSEQTFDRLVDEGEQRLGRSGMGLFATGALGGVDVVTGLRLAQVPHKVLAERAK